MLVVKDIFSYKKGEIIEIECFFSMPEKGMDTHFCSEICIERTKEGIFVWYGYPHGNHSKRVEDREVIEYIRKKIVEYKIKKDEVISELIDTLSEI